MEEVGKKNMLKGPKEKAGEEEIDEHDLLAIQIQCIEDNKAWFPDVAPDLGHHLIGMIGEVGEFAEIVKKVDRGSRELNDETYAEMALELVDVLIYLCSCASILNVDLAKLYHQKREYNDNRFRK